MVAPAGILLRLQALAGREAPQCYESLAYGDEIRVSTEEPTKKTVTRTVFFVGAPAGTRIPDTLIKSQVLYRLSYRGM